MVRRKLQVEFAGATYNSPLWLASGTFGWGVEAHKGRFFPKSAGALVTKGVSPEPMHGAPQPRVAEVGHGVGLLNAIGLQNPGVDAFVAKYAMAYAKPDWTCPVWINVFADRLEGYLDVICKIRPVCDGSAWMRGFELNVSCPNVKKGGLEFGGDPVGLENLVRHCVEVAGPWPVMVKLSPLFPQVAELARACEAGGARALSMVNTLTAGFPEPEKKSASGGPAWSIGRRFGGLSGPALRPVALRVLDQVARSVKLPLCGIGGIRTAHDVHEFLAAGATVVQVGTANFTDPWVCDGIAAGL